MMRRRTVSDQSGFTLIEVLVAALMLVIVVGAIYGAFRAGNQSSRMIEEDADLHQTARVLLGRINSELCSLYTPTGQQGISLQGENSEKNGGPSHFDKLTFTTLSHQPCGSVESKGDVCSVTYSAECADDGKPLGMFVKEDYTPYLHINDTDADAIPPVRLSDLVVGMDCTYLDPTTGEWVDEWADQTALPAAVRVELTLQTQRTGAAPITVAMTTNLTAVDATEQANSTGGSSGGRQ